MFIPPYFRPFLYPFRITLPPFLPSFLPSFFTLPFVTAQPQSKMATATVVSTIIYLYILK
jgi:hypothetical protein